jgi:hypothetical protein
MRNFNMKITDELHKRLRIVCAHEEKEMSEIVRKLIEEYVEKAEKRLKLLPITRKRIFLDTRRLAAFFDLSLSAQ